MTKRPANKTRAVLRAEMRSVHGIDEPVRRIGGPAATTQEICTKARQSSWVAGRRAALVPRAGLHSVLREAVLARAVPRAKLPHRVPVAAFRLRASLFYQRLILELRLPSRGLVAVDGAALDERLDRILHLGRVEEPRAHGRARGRRGLLLREPLLDGGPLVDLAVLRGDRIDGQLLSDRAHELVRNAVYHRFNPLGFILLLLQRRLQLALALPDLFPQVFGHLFSQSSILSDNTSLCAP
eukprot:CAMPEP_0119272128 /NCGR_PEP_ID=MMETSP1329-20130426/8433_1 /TAXON_ID=114041 /ORGANISM="Genus nov. species nov., Strain RCC1024" /LENGTH=239 /DNA_ID=CAMNT_0007272181 /DNA_START=86 /DNA_END=801 /DNA_ORIENTATION=+